MYLQLQVFQMVRRTRRKRSGSTIGNAAIAAAPPYIKRHLPFFDPLDEEQLLKIDQQVDWMLENIGFAFRDDPEAIRIWNEAGVKVCLLYTSPSPRDGLLSRMPSSA